MKTLICDCNRTLPLDLPGLRQALSRTPGADAAGLDAAHTLLCRHEAPAFQRAAKTTGERAEPLLVACTQESRLFLDLNAQTEGAAGTEVRPIRFVNLRETGGWSRDAAAATPKLAALIAQAQLPEHDPVPTVSYRSAGRVLVIGAADAAESAAAMLADKLDVSLLVDRPRGTLAQAHQHPVHSGTLSSLRGWLGAFDAVWQSANPIDLDVCTRCNACIAACPEGAIDFSYQVDLSACRSHRACVSACAAAGAIDFDRAPQRSEQRFDLVLDLRDAPAFSQHQPPQGYFHVGGDAAGDAARLLKAVLQLRELVGEFEKPRFFGYRDKLCAHSRNQQIGCTACIDVCSAQAIRSDATLKGKTLGKHRGGPVDGPLSAGTGRVGSPGALVQGQGGGVVVEPHLCVGCGACSTVCPSGALSFAYPGPASTGARLRTMLTAYAQAGGQGAALLLHSQGAGSALVDALGRAAQAGQPGRGVPGRAAAWQAAGRPAAAALPGGGLPGLHGVPARVLPVALWHTASVGIELWLAAIAQGASQVWVLVTDEEAPDYRRALREQMAVAQAVLTGLGFGGAHLRLIEAGDAATLDAALRAPAAQGVAKPAGFSAQADKRGTLELALDHLREQSPLVALPALAAGPAVDEIALPAAGSPLGSLRVDADKCTLCLSCVGACPEAALADNPDKPQLKFIEKNCVQCGLCATTCPEQAITLAPRLWLADGGKARKQARVLHEVAPFACMRCSKPFGTLKAIEGMMAKLAGHAAFQGAAADRLKMCGDCRVIDMHTSAAEVRITDIDRK